MIKVSVIIPAYNAKDYIKKCLDSLVSQTLKEIEIIVINDGSHDDTSSIVRAYQEKYSNIVFLDNKKNMGIGKCRNMGLDAARGEYIAFLDSDDFVIEDAYEKSYRFCHKNKLDFMCSHYYKVFPFQTKLFQTDLFPFSNVYKNPALLYQVDYGPCNKLLLRETIEKYHIRFPENIKYEDMPFIANVLFHSKKVGHLEDAYYYYRIHGGSETTTMDEKVFDIFKVMDMVNTTYQKEKKLEKALEYLNIRDITRYMLRQKYQEKKEIRKKFILEGYHYLDTTFPSWKQNSFYQKEPFLKRFIKNHKCLVSFYCFIYSFRRSK